MRGGATEEQLLDIIASAVKGKKKQHAGMHVRVHVHVYY